MDKYNVHQKKDAGRTTQYMSENFSDLADMANNKLLDNGVSKERRIEVLKEINSEINSSLKKADQIPQSAQLQKIMTRLQNVNEELENHIAHI
ncbi:MAG: hypothetical protein NE328_04605 [Lentisphaeraceae bacterium]|nr:hypothetical protein [Lentisphaeraceae bacterium]